MPVVKAGTSKKKNRRPKVSLFVICHPNHPQGKTHPSSHHPKGLTPTPGDTSISHKGQNIHPSHCFVNTSLRLSRGAEKISYLSGENHVCTGETPCAETTIFCLFFSLFCFSMTAIFLFWL